MASATHSEVSENQQKESQSFHNNLGDLSLPERNSLERQNIIWDGHMDTHENQAMCTWLWVAGRKSHAKLGMEEWSQQETNSPQHCLSSFSNYTLLAREASCLKGYALRSRKRWEEKKKNCLLCIQNSSLPLNVLVTIFIAITKFSTKFKGLLKDLG